MKVLFVTTCYPNEDFPQYCIFLEQQAQALNDLGVETDVLVLEEGKEKTLKSGVLNGIKVFKVGIDAGTKKDIFFPTKLSRYDEENIAKNIKSDYDIISFHFGGLRILRSIINICKLKGIKLVNHFHGLNVWYEFQENKKWLYDYYRIQKRMVFSKLDAVVGVSNKVTERFTKVIKQVPAYTVYNGVNYEMFENLHRKFLKGDKYKLLIVANLIELKGHIPLIKAIHKATLKGIKAELTIVGRGPLESKLKKIVDELGLRNDINFAGYVNYEKVVDIMKENDIFIMPSYYEALGCVYLEAMANGMITVGVYGQGIDEIIETNHNGFLLIPNDVDSIVTVLEKICNLDESELKNISDSAVETSRKYSWQNSAKMLKDVYLGLVEEHEQV